MRAWSRNVGTHFLCYRQDLLKSERGSPLVERPGDTPDLFPSKVPMQSDDNRNGEKQLRQCNPVPAAQAIFLLNQRE
jgi:hypothetical protein